MAIALRLASDGFNIALNDIPSMEKELETVQREIVDAGKQALICLGDVSVEKDVISMVELTVQKLGSLDVVCGQSAQRCLSLLSDFTSLYRR